MNIDAKDVTSPGFVRRRSLLRIAAWTGVSSALSTWSTRLAAKSPVDPTTWRRVRPGDAAWPKAAAWRALGTAVGGRLVAVGSLFAGCAKDGACVGLRKDLKNPYFIGDQVALTQASGWFRGWRSQPSAFAVAAEQTADVVAAVDFARVHRLRLVIKGGGHAYQGTSSAPDSLLIWMRPMRTITLHDAFVADGCGVATARPAVTIEAGALWNQAYDAVTTNGGRYVQGGGCMTVGVAGLVQGGGFGSHSKNYGLAAASLLQAEVVTADGQVRTANACSNPDLFWALKGGGGGSFGVVTRLTLATHALPPFFGVVIATIEATSDDAYRRLVARFVDFYAERLFGRHWGEQAVFEPRNRLSLTMLSQGLGQGEITALWQPFFQALREQPGDYRLVGDPIVLAIPARSFWDAAFLRRLPGIVIDDDRPGASSQNVFWAADADEPGQFIHAYRSTWLSAALLAADRRPELCAALFASSRHWRIALHFNKGLAGGPPESLAAARDTAMNPAVVDAFALAITAAEGPQRFVGAQAKEVDEAAAVEAKRVEAAFSALQAGIPTQGAYASESSYFDADWQVSNWGANYPRLMDVKRRYDPDGLFYVHHGVGSEGWRDDGFTRIH